MFMGLWTVWPKQPAPVKSGKMKVVTSFYPLYFLANEIGKEKVEVTNLTPAGVEPHDYELTARDIMAVQQAKLLILNGGRLEAWGDKVKKDLKGSGLAVLEVGESLIENNDPHVWLSQTKYKQELWLVEKKLVELDPLNEEYYLSRATDLDQRLTKQKEEFDRGLRSCRLKDFITSHQAFGYLANDFGLREVAIAGLTPEEEPSTKQLAEVAKIAKDKEIRFIFFEKLVNPKLSETIAQEVGAKTLVLDPAEGISDNDLKLGKNYFTIMAENLNNLRIALECQ